MVKELINHCVFGSRGYHLGNHMQLLPGYATVGK